MAKSDAIPPLGLGTYGRTGDKSTQDILSPPSQLAIATLTWRRHMIPRQASARLCAALKREDFFITTKVADYNLSRE